MEYWNLLNDQILSYFIYLCHLFSKLIMRVSNDYKLNEQGFCYRGLWGQRCAEMGYKMGLK